MMEIQKTMQFDYDIPVFLPKKKKNLIEKKEGLQGGGSLTGFPFCSLLIKETASRVQLVGFSPRCDFPFEWILKY